DDGDEAPPHVDDAGDPGRRLGQRRDRHHAHDLDHVLDRQCMFPAADGEDEDLDAVEADRPAPARPGIARAVPGAATHGVVTGIDRWVRRAILLPARGPDDPIRSRLRTLARKSCLSLLSLDGRWT